jgi:hypothetical protein
MTPTIRPSCYMSRHCHTTSPASTPHHNSCMSAANHTTDNDGLLTCNCQDDGWHASVVPCTALPNRRLVVQPQAVRWVWCASPAVGNTPHPPPPKWSTVAHGTDVQRRLPGGVLCQPTNSPLSCRLHAQLQCRLNPCTAMGACPNLRLQPQGRQEMAAPPGLCPACTQCRQSQLFGDVVYKQGIGQKATSNCLVLRLCRGSQ